MFACNCFGVDLLSVGGEESLLKAWCDSKEGGDSVLHEEMCHTVHWVAVNWSIAVKECRGKGGELLKMEDKMLPNYIFNRTYDDQFWIGGKERDGKFYWTDGNVV